MELQKSILLFFSGIDNAFLNKLVEFVTMFGETLVPLAIALLLYWCADKKKGAVTSLILFSANVTMNFIKALVRFPRPWVLIPELQTGRIETATGYSFPSGHSTTASSFYSAIAFAFKKRAISIICALLILLVPLSRLYLCVHWPLDVFCGTVLGFGTSFFLFTKLCNFYDNRKKYIKQIIITGAAFSLVSFVLAALVCAEVIDKTAFTDFTKNMAMLGGVLIGFAVEEKNYDFKIDGSLLQKAIRYVVGMGIAVLILEGSKKVMPYNALTSCLRYFAGGVWVCLYPLLGRKIKLFN